VQPTCFWVSGWKCNQAFQMHCITRRKAGFFMPVREDTYTP
jgi:hypothetical protein